MKYIGRSTLLRARRPASLIRTASPRGALYRRHLAEMIAFMKWLLRWLGEEVGEVRPIIKALDDASIYFHNRAYRMPLLLASSFRVGEGRHQAPPAYNDRLIFRRCFSRDANALQPSPAYVDLPPQARSLTIVCAYIEIEK